MYKEKIHKQKYFVILQAIHQERKFSMVCFALLNLLLVERLLYDSEIK